MMMTNSSDDAARAGARGQALLGIDESVGDPERG